MQHMTVKRLNETADRSSYHTYLHNISVNDTILRQKPVLNILQGQNSREIENLQMFF